MARRRRITRKRRRSPLRRVLRRRRRRGRAHNPGRRRNGGSLFSRSWGKISTTLGGLAFFQQITEKDLIGTENMPIADKAKVFINSVTGRLFGIGVAPGIGHSPQTFNFAGIFNKWTGLGAGLWAIGHIPLNIPHKGKAKTLGKALLTGGILGGFFDAPDDKGIISATNFQFASQHTARPATMMTLSTQTASTLK